MTHLVAFCACLCAQYPEPGPELRLPWGVRGEVFGAAQSAPDQPLERVVFEATREWMRSELYQRTGSFGWSLQQFRLGSWSESLLYDAPRRTGTRDMAFATTGAAPGEGNVSPVCWARLLKMQGASLRVKERRADGTTVYVCPEPGRRATLEITVSGGEIAQVQSIFLPNPKIVITYRYSDWRDLPDGSRHPWRVEVDRRLGSAGNSDEVLVAQHLEPLPEGAKPTPFELPREASILDSIEHVQRDGTMKAIGPVDPIKPSRAQSAATQAAERPWLIWGGVAALVLAAVVWRVRAKVAT